MSLFLSRVQMLGAATLMTCILFALHFESHTGSYLTCALQNKEGPVRAYKL